MENSSNTISIDLGTHVIDENIERGIFLKL